MEYEVNAFRESGGLSKEIVKQSAMRYAASVLPTIPLR